MQNKRLHKKILAKDEMNKINFNDMSVEAQTYGNHIFHIGEDLTTYDHKQRKDYRRHLEFERACLDSLLKRVAVELDEISDKTLAYRAVHTFLEDEFQTASVIETVKPSSEPEPATLFGWLLGNEKKRG